MLKIQRRLKNKIIDSISPLKDICRDELYNRIEYFTLYFISYISTKQRNTNMVNISSKTLKTFFGSGSIIYKKEKMSVYKIILDLLENNNIIYINKIYNKKRFTKSYSIDVKYFCDIMENVTKPKSKSLDNRLRLLEDNINNFSQNDELGEIEKRIENSTNRTFIKKYKAKKYIFKKLLSTGIYKLYDGLTVKKLTRYQLDNPHTVFDWEDINHEELIYRTKIKKGKFGYRTTKFTWIEWFNRRLDMIDKFNIHYSFFRDGESRIYNRMTSISSELHKFLRFKTSKGNKIKLSEIDFKSSQVQYLALRFQKETGNRDDKLLNKIKDDFYIYCSELLGLEYTKESRKDIKTMVFADILYANEIKKSSLLYQKLKNNHPEFIEWLDNKRIRGITDDHIAKTIQEEEANMIIDVIGRRLIDHDIWFITKHDAIFTFCEIEDPTRKLINDCFNDIYGCDAILN